MGLFLFLYIIFLLILTDLSEEKTYDGGFVFNINSTMIASFVCSIFLTSFLTYIIIPNDYVTENKTIFVEDVEKDKDGYYATIGKYDIVSIKTKNIANSITYHNIDMRNLVIYEIDTIKPKMELVKEYRKYKNFDTTTKKGMIHKILFFDYYGGKTHEMDRNMRYILTIPKNSIKKNGL